MELRLRETMIERMTHVIDAFESPNEMLNLEQVQHRTGLPRSTTHRIIVEMIKWGWLERRGRLYLLGPRALGAVGPIAAHSRIRVAAGDILQDLYLQTGLVIHLGVLDGGQEHFLDKIGGPFARNLRSRVGGRTQAHRGAGGRAMLALLPPEEVETITAASFVNRDPREVWEIDSLHRELARIRQARGIAFEPTETASGIEAGGIGSVGCAFRAGDGTPVSLCAAGHSKQVNLARVAPLVKRATEQLAVKIGGSRG